ARVVLEYHVGDVRVYETPWAVDHDERVLFTRTLQIAPRASPLTLALGDAPRDATVQRAGNSQLIAGEVEGAIVCWSLTSDDEALRLETGDGRIQFIAAAGNSTSRCKLTMFRVPLGRND